MEQRAIHQSAQRLYKAASHFKSIQGKSAVAALLNLAPQMVNNWEHRGVSEGGALLAQRRIGCDANWVLTGEGELDQRPSAEAAQIAAEIDAFPPTVRGLVLRLCREAVEVGRELARAGQMSQNDDGHSRRKVKQR